jgi:tRNA modification GTPase
MIFKKAENNGMVISMRKKQGDIDTIASIATPKGHSGIGVIRVSGSKALEIAKKIFLARKGKAKRFESHRQILGEVKAAQGLVRDEGMLTFFKAPYSYTCEDVVEISCHGSPVILDAVLTEIFRLGARQAEAGEFTLRAVQNGRIDLAQAEAVNELVHATNVQHARLAFEMLEGRLSEYLKQVSEEMSDIHAWCEASIEFVEDMEEECEEKEISKRLRGVRDKLTNLLKDSEGAKNVRREIHVVIAGLANVGKSTLFNALLGHERAIVTKIPGTTRDTLRETVQMDGIQFTLIDTAGLRKTGRYIETKAIKRSKREVRDADIVLEVVDPGIPESMRRMRKTKRKEVVFVVNKMDIHRSTPIRKHVPNVKISALREQNLDELKNRIVEHASQVLQRKGSVQFLVNQRHEEIIKTSIERLSGSMKSVKRGLLEIAVEELKRGIRELSKITRAQQEDVLHRIFRTFCIGK